MASLNKSTFFLEPVVQGEVSQKEKNKYHILMPDEPIRKAVTEMWTYRTDVRTWGGGGMSWETGIDTLLCVK